MAIKYGSVITCDRCGTQIFQSQETPRPVDGNPAPEGWTLKATGGGDLCPYCTEMYQVMLAHFMEGEPCNIRGCNKAEYQI